MILAGAYVLPGAFFFTRGTNARSWCSPGLRDFHAHRRRHCLCSLNGDALAYAWAAEAAGTRPGSRGRVREIRFQLWSGVYLVLALDPLRLFDALPRHLDYPGLSPDAVTAHPASGVGTIVAVAAASAVFLLSSRGPGVDDEAPCAATGACSPSYRGLRRGPSLRFALALPGWLSCSRPTAASLGVLAVFSEQQQLRRLHGARLRLGHGRQRRLDGDRPRAARPASARHEQLRSARSSGSRRPATSLSAKSSMSSAAIRVSFVFVVVGLAVLVASMAFGLSRHQGAARGSLVISGRTRRRLARRSSRTRSRTASTATGREPRCSGSPRCTHVVGGALPAAARATLHRSSGRSRSSSAAVADAQLLHGTYPGARLGGRGRGLAWLARRVPEPRLSSARPSLVALAVMPAFFVQAPPTHLFTTHPHPAYGAASIFIAALAVAGLAYFARAELGRLGAFRTAPWWLAGVLTVYGLSLVILELVEWISTRRSTRSSSAARPRSAPSGGCSGSRSSTSA